MVYKPLAEKYRKSSGVTTTVDFFDTITGIGYKKFYLAGAVGPAGALDFFLTTDSSVNSDMENYTVANNADIDFDIKVGKGFTVQAEDFIIVLSRFVGGGSVQNITYTLRHVDSGATESSIGTSAGDPIAPGVKSFYLKTQRIALTSKRFSKGETLRLNVTTTGGASDSFFYDPAGLRTEASETPNYAHISFILVPIEVRL